MPRLSDEKKAALESFTREAITRAVEELLLEEEGWNRITIEKVAQRTGVSKGTIYNYFRDKRDLVFSVAERNVANLEARLRRFDFSRAPGSVLEDLFDTLIRDIMDNRRTMTAIIRAVEADEELRSPRNDVTCRNPLRRVRGLIRDVLERGIEDGSFRRDDADRVETVIHSTILGFVHQLRMGVIDDDSLTPISESLKVFLLNGVRARKGEAA